MTIDSVVWSSVYNVFKDKKLDQLEVIIMVSLGSLLWIAAIGGLFYYMMSKGGGCCGGGGHNHEDHNKVGHKEHDSNSEHTAHHEQPEDKQPSEFIELRDPVCGMEVKKNSTTLISDHFGRTFHFCSEQCRKLFDINPNKYVGF
jgi:YHS domain-containing protein